MEQVWKLNAFKMSFRSSKRALLVSCRKQTLLQFYGELVMSTHLHEFQMMYIIIDGPGSSVGIANGYGLDGPGIESRRGRDFPDLFRPALGPTHPPVQ